MKQKAFTLIELLVVVAIIGVLAAVGVVAYGKYATSAKITAAKEQHYSMKKFIEASYGQCALGNNYVLMNTCKLNNWSCNGLRVGNSDPGTVKRPCKSGAGSASNSAYHFVFHFNVTVTTFAIFTIFAIFRFFFLSNTTRSTGLT